MYDTHLLPIFVYCWCMMGVCVNTMILVMPRYWWKWRCFNRIIHMHLSFYVQKTFKKFNFCITKLTTKSCLHICLGSRFFTVAGVIQFEVARQICFGVKISWGEVAWGRIVQDETWKTVSPKQRQQEILKHAGPTCLTATCTIPSILLFTLFSQILFIRLMYPKWSFFFLFSKLV